MQQAKSNGQAHPEQVKGLLNVARDSLSKMELLEDVHSRILSDVSSHLESATQVGFLTGFVVNHQQEVRVSWPKT